jgi:hypothetical protein
MSIRNTFQHMPFLKDCILAYFTAFCAHFSIDQCTAFTIGVKMIWQM